MVYGAPSLLEQTHNWGAFIFFGSWCFISLVYVYLMVPESSGLSVEELDRIFSGSWFNAARSTGANVAVLEGQEHGKNVST